MGWNAPTLDQIFDHLVTESVLFLQFYEIMQKKFRDLLAQERLTLRRERAEKTPLFVPLYLALSACFFCQRYL